jgi:hypothetical protein
MKSLVFILIIFLMPFVFGLEQTIVKTQVNVTYDYNDSSVRIIGENLNIKKDLGNFSWSEVFEIDMIRELGNESDITGLFDKLDVCMVQFNYTKKWEDCIEVNRNVSMDLILCKEDVGYESNYTLCKENLNKEKKTKIDEINKLQTDYDDVKKQNGLLLLGLVVAGGFALFFGNKCKGLKFTPREEKSELPKDTAF